jgi:arginine:pyruvate transaminase
MELSNLARRLMGTGGTESWAVYFEALRLEKEGKDIIQLGIGEHDLPTPDPIVDSAVFALRNGRHHYESEIGTPALRAAIANHHQLTCKQRVTVENCIAIAGGQCALFAALMSVVDEDDEVICLDPMYTTYFPVVKSTGAKMVMVPCLSEENFRLNIEGIEQAITAKTRAILINTPNNPTGAVYQRDKLRELADLCVKHDIWLVSDEVYATLVHEGEHASPSSFPDIADRSITLGSLSKGHMMTGWRMGWIVGPENFLKAVRELVSCMLFGLPTFIQDAAVTALTEFPLGIGGLQERYGKRLDIVYEGLSNFELCRPIKPEAGMFLMADIRKTGLSANDFSMRLLQETGVALMPGDGFGPSAEGHIRFSVGAPEDRLTEAMDRMQNFLRQF